MCSIKEISLETRSLGLPRSGGCGGTTVVVVTHLPSHCCVELREHLCNHKRSLRKQYLEIKTWWGFVCVVG